MGSSEVRSAQLPVIQGEHYRLRPGSRRSMPSSPRQLPAKLAPLARVSPPDLPGRTSTRGLEQGASSVGSRPMRAEEYSRGRPSAVQRSRSAPDRWRPHSAIGWSGVFCSSATTRHSTPGVQEASRRRDRGSSISLDLPGAQYRRRSAQVGPRLLRALPPARVRRSSSSPRPTRGLNSAPRRAGRRHRRSPRTTR